MTYLLYPLSVTLGVLLTSALFYLALLRISDENVLVYVLLTCILTYFIFQALSITYPL